MPSRVAVVLIRSQGKLLLTYSFKWRAFTCPMTKLPAWDFVDTSQIIDRDRRAISAAQFDEQWLDAAAHAVVECLGQPNCPAVMVDGPVEVEYGEVERSRRDGADRVYHYKLFTLEVPQPFQSLQQPFVWLTPAQIRDGKHRPMSPTVLEILGRAEVASIVRSW